MTKPPPIEPQEYIAGVTVVDFGDYRVSRGLSRRTFSTCPHRDLRFDSKERRIWCGDCESDIEPFDGFFILVESVDRVHKNIERRLREVKEAEQASLRSRAAKRIDEAWRSRTMVPGCPHCGQGLFPEDFATTLKGGELGREYARARLKQKAQSPSPPDASR